jgi:membrane protein involved in colicin uptake
MFHLVNKEGNCHRFTENKHKRDELVRLGYKEVSEKKALSPEEAAKKAEEAARKKAEKEAEAARKKAEKEAEAARKKAEKEAAKNAADGEGAAE